MRTVAPILNIVNPIFYFSKYIEVEEKNKLTHDLNNLEEHVKLLFIDEMLFLSSNYTLIQDVDGTKNLKETQEEFHKQYFGEKLCILKFNDLNGAEKDIKEKQVVNHYSSCKEIKDKFESVAIYKLKFAICENRVFAFIGEEAITFSINEQNVKKADLNHFQRFKRTKFY